MNMSKRDVVRHFITQHPGCTVKQVQKETGFYPMYAHAVVRQLLDLGEIVKVRKTRPATYATPAGWREMKPAKTYTKAQINKIQPRLVRIKNKVEKGTREINALVSILLDEQERLEVLYAKKKRGK